jgi:glycosyltransferase involved in cell wall biosynthesis
MAQVHYDLSVVTVVLNDVSGLEKTIQTVQSQRSLNIEHIIVDGGSNDGSARLAAKHSSVSVQSRSDGGIYPAMQRGADVATGKYLLFCNAGDLIFGAAYLQLAVKELNEVNADWGFGPIIELTQRKTFAWVPANSEANSISIIARKVFVPFPSFIINRNQFESIGGFSDKYKIAGDFELVCKVAKISSPTIFAEPIALFSAGGVSYTNADIAWKEEIYIRREVLDLSRVQLFTEQSKFWLRFTKWKFGKFLDILEKNFIKPSTSWRDKRAQKVPARYLSELD